jgi:hypothetical protein
MALHESRRRNSDARALGRHIAPRNRNFYIQILHFPADMQCIKPATLVMHGNFHALRINSVQLLPVAESRAGLMTDQPRRIKTPPGKAHKSVSRTKYLQYIIMRANNKSRRAAHLSALTDFYASLILKNHVTCTQIRLYVDIILPSKYLILKFFNNTEPTIAGLSSAMRLCECKYTPIAIDHRIV